MAPTGGTNSCTSYAPVTCELEVVAGRLLAATTPLAVFGALRGTTETDPAGSAAAQVAQLRRAYRQLALSVHPDRHQNAPLAQRAFTALHNHYLLAQEQLRDGQYGVDTAPAEAVPVTLTTRHRTYVVGRLLAEGDLANLYTCTVADRAGRERGVTRGAILKVARDGRDNDFLANEVATLRHLAMPAGSAPVPAYLPRVLESFVYRDPTGEARQATAFPLVETEAGPLAADGWFTLREVRAAYPTGVDPRAMAWIWRRLLITLGHARDRDVVHGGVLPPHILVHPEAHGLLLVDWCASLRQPGQHDRYIPLVSAEYEAWYPSSVLAKRTPAPTVDIEMALCCMVELLGGDALTGALPPSVPAPMQAHLQSTLRASAQANASTRPGVRAGHSPADDPLDAWTLYRDFSSLLANLWGKRAFIPFTMPARR